METITADLDQIFAALADPARRSILEQLAAGEATVGTVAGPLRMAMPSVSKHVKVLERAGLIARRVEGRRHWLSLSPAGFRSAAQWFTTYQQFWSESVDRLTRRSCSSPTTKEQTHDCSGPKAGSITGTILTVDGGGTRLR